MTTTMARQLEAQGYQYPREVPGQGWCGVRQLLFTTALFVGTDETGYARRYCYADYDAAVAALAQWAGHGDPPGPWIKEKPGDRRGPGAAPVREEEINNAPI